MEEHKLRAREKNIWKCEVETGQCTALTDMTRICTINTAKLLLEKLNYVCVEHRSMSEREFYSYLSYSTVHISEKYCNSYRAEVAQSV
jgi:hypothetical protein